MKRKRDADGEHSLGHPRNGEPNDQLTQNQGTYRPATTCTVPVPKQDDTLLSARPEVVLVRSHIASISIQGDSVPFSTFSSSSFKLLDLPGEIRNNIYENALAFDQKRHRKVTIDRDNPARSGRLCRAYDIQDGCYPSLLLTCRQIHTEASTFVYGSNTFVFLEASVMELFLAGIGDQVKLIQSITLGAKVQFYTYGHGAVPIAYESGLHPVIRRTTPTYYSQEDQQDVSSYLSRATNLQIFKIRILATLSGVLKYPQYRFDTRLQDTELRYSNGALYLFRSIKDSIIALYRSRQDIDVMLALIKVEMSRDFGPKPKYATEFESDLRSLIIEYIGCCCRTNPICRMTARQHLQWDSYRWKENRILGPETIHAGKARQAEMQQIYEECISKWIRRRCHCCRATEFSLDSKSFIQCLYTFPDEEQDAELVY